MKTIVGLLAVMFAMSACVRDIHAPYVPSDEEIFRLVVRTPLRSVNLPDSVRKIPIALLEIGSLPQEPPEGREMRLISFPDEILIESGENWVFTPSPGVVPITDVFVHGLRHAGLKAEALRTLNKAKNAGSRIAIVSVLNTADVRIKKPWAFSLASESAAEAICRLSVALVDIQTTETLWVGSLHEVIRHNRAVKLPSVGVFIEGEAMDGSGERRTHQFRVLMTQCYYHLSMDLALRLVDALSKVNP
jgi:hypothetical protein